MTTQDIYAWVQMGLQIVIGGGIVVGISRYFGLLRRAIESQKATIEAQAEHMKAQSAILQDFERHSKIMQQVIDFFEPQAQLRREQAYKELVERDIERVERDWKEYIHKLRASSEPLGKHLQFLSDSIEGLRAMTENARAQFENFYEEKKKRAQPDSSLGHELPAGCGANGDSDDQS